MNILENIQHYANTIPERIAIQSGADHLTYGELWEYSDRIASWLLENNPSPGEPIPVYGHKHPWMIACFLGCVKAGCAYCPIDTSVPAKRTQSILEALSSGLVIALEPLETSLPQKQLLTAGMLEEILFETPAEATSIPDNENWVNGASDFYLIFTSGSTGTPKGVQISADCLNHFLEWSITLIDRQNSLVFLNQAPFSFDLSVMDLYTCLAVGGTLYCLTKTVQSGYALLMQALEASRAAVWVSTPSFVDMCLSEHRFCADLLPALTTFLFCGETLANGTVKRLQERFPDADIYNTYGPTESTVAVTQILVTPERNALENPLPVGCARPGTRLVILDENHQPLPEGEKGEITIIGDTVSTGYYHAPELTKQAFFLQEDPSGRALRGYRTGDRGYLKNGLLYYCGRMDLQIKLHGYRIELEDIENNLRKLPQIRHAVVLPNHRNGKVSSLTAFVEAQSLPENTKDASLHIRQQLAAFLPDYMIPKKYIFLEQMPMTGNGKANRRLLEAQR